MQENSSTNTHENGGVKALMHFYKTIENNEVEELKNILEQEQLAKQTLNVGLTRAITNYRNNSDSIDIIDSLLSNNADPNLFIQHKNSNQQAASSEKITILMFACLKGDLQLIHTILKHNPNVNLKDSFQRNALFYAITADKGDNADIVLTLINSGINVNQTEKESKDGPPLAGHSPLTLASQKNLRNTVKALLDNGADPDWTVLKDGNTAMHYAVRNSNIHIIEKLLSKNANPMAINKDNLTPLSLALKLSHTDIYKSLVEVHNKIAQREDESAQTLMTENKVNNNSSSKKKKKPKEADTFSYEKPVSLEEKDFNDEDKAEKEIAQPNKQEINKDNTLNTNNKDNSLNNNTFITNHTSSTPSQKKKNPKLELLSQLKELKLTNLKHQNSKSNNETGSSQNIKKDPLSLLEVPFQINKKINDSIQRKVESYLSNFLALF
jgi:ankyrin repeat protein